jgi:hypothetical protein
MASALKKFAAAWKKFAHKLGVGQTYLLITLLYALVIPFFSLIRLSDPLRLRQKPDGSFWILRKRRHNSLEETRHQF